LPASTSESPFSPDGRRVAFNAGLGGASGEAFYLRSLDELESRRGKEVASGGSAFFSPDGRYVGFFTNAAPTVMGKLALSGGAAITICPHEGGFAGAAWTADDTIYFVPQIPAD
jgi:hypothetical protein